MMAIKLIPLLQVAMVLSGPLHPTHGFPSRFGRLQRASDHQHYAAQVYDLPQAYPDKYFYEALSYPVYYPRTSKYEVFQAVLPYYYDQPAYYGYDESGDTMADLEEAMYRDAERKQREDAQPIGQETYFEDAPAVDDDADVHAAFVNNLIMSQMYRDALAGDNGYGKVDDFPPPRYPNEDDEVMELKSLAGRKPPPKAEERLRWFQKSASADEVSEKKRSADGHPEGTTTAQPDAHREASVRGQKEEVLPRPANPTKLPIAAHKKDRQRQPSVYDTIKHMLEMERSLEKQNDAAATSNHPSDVIMPPMWKRIVASEDDLAHQLAGLKKYE